MNKEKVSIREHEEKVILLNVRDKVEEIPIEEIEDFFHEGLELDDE